MKTLRHVLSNIMCSSGVYTHDFDVAFRHHTSLRIGNQDQTITRGVRAKRYKSSGSTWELRAIVSGDWRENESGKCIIYTIKYECKFAG